MEEVIMKKIVGVIFTLAVLSFSFVFAFFPAKTSAASAPPLTDLQIIGITSDGNDNEWEIISPNQLSAITPLKGRNIRIAIYVEGTERPGFLRIYNGGRDITSQTRKPLADEPLSGSDKIVYGWIKYYEIPMRLLTTESISISALDYFSNKTLYDHINFTIVRE
jgi:Domain of unknown function (DUF4879)